MQKFLPNSTNNSKHYNMALIDKEQICAEIKVQKNAAEVSYVPGDDNNYWYGKVVLCDELLAFIDSIPEQPVNGLEEEIARYLRDECSSDDEPSISDIARHFAEWGAEHLKR